jgi:hypothetical protein
MLYLTLFFNAIFSVITPHALNLKIMCCNFNRVLIMIVNKMHMLDQIEVFNFTTPLSGLYLYFGLLFYVATHEGSKD